jgi:hypothetical protein
LHWICPCYTERQPSRLQSQPYPTGDDKKNYQSEVALAYLDCKNSQLAFGSRTMYADSDGMGHVVFNIELTLNDVRLRASAAGSTGEQLIKSVCPKPPQTSALAPATKK